jgi:hypothetical protein
MMFFQPDYYRDAPHFRRVGDGPQYRLEIPRAKLDFTGAYSVIARNCHAEAKAVISLQIYAKGKYSVVQLLVATSSLNFNKDTPAVLSNTYCIRTLMILSGCWAVGKENCEHNSYVYCNMN